MSSIDMAPDANVALALAATAMPFARDADEEAARWLRILRVHGDAGVALSALGVSESPLEEPARRTAGGQVDSASRDVRDPAAQVTEQAAQLAGQRGADVVTTGDVLVAVMQVYGEHFDRVLVAHGTDRDEVLAQLELR
jgi:succinylarginine dihydrolase